MNNAKNEVRNRRSLKVQDIDTAGVEVKGGAEASASAKAMAEDYRDCSGGLPASESNKRTGA